MSIGRLLGAVWTAAAAITLAVPSAAECGQSTATSPSTDTAPQASQPATSDKAMLERVGQTLNASNIDVDLTVPESPAFTALGLSPETIVRPTTPREFATALLNGVDQQGHLQTGIAVDTVPYLVFAGRHITLADYRDSRVTQVLSRTAVSFATTRGATSEDKSVKLALGVHATLYDSEDPRLDDEVLRCYGAIPVFRPAVTQLPIDLDPSKREAQAKELERQRLAFEETQLKPAVDGCRQKFKLPARWNGTSWIVAIAPSWVSPTGLGSDIDSGALGFWTSVSYGFDGVPGLRDSAQLIGHVRHLSNETVVDQALPGGQETRDTTFAGARLRAGTNTFGFSFEAAYVRTSAAGRASDAAARLAFAAERRLAENLWLTVSFGGDRGVDQGTSRGLSLLSAFKWGLAKDSRLTPKQVAGLPGGAS